MFRLTEAKKRSAAGSLMTKYEFSASPCRLTSRSLRNLTVAAAIGQLSGRRRPKFAQKPTRPTLLSRALAMLKVIKRIKGW